MLYPRVFQYENGAMKYALLAVMWALSLVAADQPRGLVYAHDRDHGGEQAGDTDCPAYRNGLKCYGFGIMDGYTINGPKYRCSLCGARWLVTTERQPARRSSPSDCPGYLNGGNGLKCIGFGIMEGLTVNGTKYRCTICGCRWIAR